MAQRLHLYSSSPALHPGCRTPRTVLLLLQDIAARLPPVDASRNSCPARPSKKIEMATGSGQPLSPSLVCDGVFVFFVVRYETGPLPFAALSALGCLARDL